MIDKQSWDDEGTVSEQMLRTSLLMFACVRKYKPCVDKAQEYFMKWKNSDGTLKYVFHFLRVLKQYPSVFRKETTIQGSVILLGGRCTLQIKSNK